MTSISGANNFLILLDSDAVIASILEDDALHKKATEIFELLAKKGVILYITTTVVAETAVGLHRKFNQRDKSLNFLEKTVSKWVKIIAVDEDLLIDAYQVLRQTESKKNTIFDAINVTVMRKHNLTAIFSFDEFYKKNGLKLAGEMI